MENAKLQTRHVEWWQKSLFALELAKELEGSNLSFNLIHWKPHSTRRSVPKPKMCTNR